VIARGWAARLIPSFRPPVDGTVFATFAPPSEPVVWLACHNLACGGHMATPHTPDDQGTATCNRCGQIRLDHQ
jgi:hypothetical protein